MSSKVTTWDVHRQYGPAGPFHQRMPSADTGHEIWVRTIPRPALVLGSTQPDELVRSDRAERDGIEVARRRSGGGLVWIDPATDCWIDVIVPIGSPLWQQDIGRAFHWLGERWAAVIGEVSPSSVPLVRHATAPRSGPSTPGPGRVWCFADVGHGEITLDGSKILGLSQRRTRHWARLQGLLLGAWPGEELDEYVDLEVAAALAPGVSEKDLQPRAIRAGYPRGIAPPAPSDTAERFIAALVDP